MIDIIVNRNPQNIRNVGTSEQIKNPKVNAAKGSAPDIMMDDTPESIYFKLTVERIYGRANENVECIIRNMIANVGLTDMKPVIWLKFVNGINAIEMKTIE